MLRMITLVEVVEGADVAELVAAGREAIADDPLILGQIEPGLGLLADVAPHAAYSIMLDFEDEEAMRRYLAGSPHAVFAALATPFITRTTVTEYFLDNA